MIAEEVLAVPATIIQRDEILRVLSGLFSLRWRGLRAEEIPVQFLEKRIAVVLPAEAFTADEQIKIEGKFQHLMARRGISAFLDFVKDWQGLKTKLDTGFN